MDETNSQATWYRPEFPPDATRQNCYCGQQAYGRTRYWDGVRSVYKYQCRKHLPAVPVTVEAVAS